MTLWFDEKKKKYINRDDSEYFVKYSEDIKNELNTRMNGLDTQMDTHSSSSILDHPDQSVTTAKLADNCVTSDKILNASVTAEKLGGESVTTEKIAYAAVTTQELADLSVTTQKLTDQSITTQKLSDQSVTTGKLKDEGVTTGKIADNAITAMKIAEGNVTNMKLQDGAVDTIKIADFSVNNFKIGPNAVTTSKIADEAITAMKIKDGNVTNAKLQDGAVDTRTLADFAVDSFKIAPNAINENKLSVELKQKINAGLTPTANVAYDTGRKWIDGNPVMRKDFLYILKKDCAYRLSSSICIQDICETYNVGILAAYAMVNVFQGYMDETDPQNPIWVGSYVAGNPVDVALVDCLPITYDNCGNWTFPDESALPTELANNDWAFFGFVEYVIKYDVNNEPDVYFTNATPIIVE